MHNIILFGDDHWFSLQPITITRPIAELRVGMLTIKEKWQHYFPGSATSVITQEYLNTKFPINIKEDNYLINSTFIPNPIIVEKVLALKPNQALMVGDEMFAARVSEVQMTELNLNPETFDTLESYEMSENVISSAIRIRTLADIVRYNESQIKADINLVTKGKSTAPISNSNKIIGKSDVFFAKGVIAECCVFNTNDGPIYIGEDTELMEGSFFRGPIAIGSKNIVKMGAKIYGGTSSGPGCRLGGEIKNTVFIGNSNKGHEGFVGDSVIGEWCNLGADTNTSNLKNNYQPVKLWSYPSQKFEDTGLQFCGLIMGDHSKCGINTMFNTGTVVGIACNIFGDGYPRNFIPSFSWGGAAGFITHQLSKAIETAEIVVGRRNLQLTTEDKNILQHVYETETK
jgi:UDP-N-acetylglucosamine diphosphorylase/glucosamine-1-phosphate N-acetyltransferase